MTRTTLGNLLLSSTLAMALSACGGSASTYRIRSHPPMAGGPGGDSTAYGPSGGATAAPAQARASEAYESQPDSRPGLGTAWGERRFNATRTTSFVRDDVDNPFAVTTLWYNDQEGAHAMARRGDYRPVDFDSNRDLGGMVSVKLRDASGRPLESFWAAGRRYVIGEPGERYTIELRNYTGQRFECVASVDGLDVIDGLAASFEKRGYVLDPYASLEIEGYRESDDTVAAFRFSSVRGSYASRSGQGDRHVGVIGIALFQERNSYPRWSNGEIERRHDADPFPNRYAVPPWR